MSRLSHCLFLDSAPGDPVLGRHSFVAADPFDYFEVLPVGSDGLGDLARGLDALRVETASRAARPPIPAHRRWWPTIRLSVYIDLYPPPPSSERADAGQAK